MPRSSAKNPPPQTGFSVAAIRSAQQKILAAAPFGALLARAAAGLAAQVIQLLNSDRGGVYGRRVVLLIGPGFNGADTLWAGVLLAQRGAHVEAVLLAAPEPRALAAFHRVGSPIKVDNREAAQSALARAELIVDGILGIGGRPGLPPRFSWIVDVLPPAVPIVAADVPSGVDPDSGELPGRHLRADLTVSFGAAAAALLLPPAALAAGRVAQVPLGFAAEDLGPPQVRTMTAHQVASLWPQPRTQEHKYSRGVLGVVAGSSSYPGAAVLTVTAAQGTGLGLIRFCGPAAVTQQVLAAVPETVPMKDVSAGRVQAWLLGPGLDQELPATYVNFSRWALASGLPCVVDAGALRLLPELAAPVGVVATPHAGELAELAAQLAETDRWTREAKPPNRALVEQRPSYWAREIAALLGVIVLLKGPISVIADPAGRLIAQPSGPSWLATAGSGDVLAGIIGALLAQGVPAAEAAAMAVLVHGRAAQQANRDGPVRAAALAQAVPAVVAEVLGGSGAAGRWAEVAD